MKNIFIMNVEFNYKLLSKDLKEIISAENCTNLSIDIGISRATLWHLTYNKSCNYNINTVLKVVNFFNLDIHKYLNLNTQ